MRAIQFCLCFVLCVGTLVNNASGADTQLDSALYDAVLFQDLPQVQSLIARGANANHKVNGRPVLAWASQNGNVAIVDALLKGGANPNVADQGIGHTPLMRAIETQHTEIVRSLLKAKANPNAASSEGKSCIMFAIDSHKPEIMQALLDAGANAKAVAGDGSSPALTAAQDGQPESLEMIRMLGKAGADMNVSNAAYTPLVYAIQQNNIELVRALLDAGAQPNAKTSAGDVPLQAALDSIPIMQLLLEKKADPNVAADADGLLIYAIRNNNSEAAKLLINAGADTKKVDYAGYTALQLAEQNGMGEIAGLLRPTSGASTSYQVYDASTGNGGPCTIVDAARKQMEIHGLLQQQVDAGKKSSDIFRTFNEDTKDYGRLLTEDPPAACDLLEKLRTKYGV